VGVWMQWKIVLVGGVFGPIQLPSRMLWRVCWPK
jgi:hypothetical protein